MATKYHLTTDTCDDNMTLLLTFSSSQRNLTEKNLKALRSMYPGKTTESSQMATMDDVADILYREQTYYTDNTRVTYKIEI